MTAHELLRKMPEVLDREAAAGIDATIQYDVAEPLHHVLKDGEVTIHEGPAEEPDLVVRVDDEDLRKLFYGEMNPLTAFMSGRIKVEGDMQLAQRLVQLVDRDRLVQATREADGAASVG